MKPRIPLLALLAVSIVACGRLGASPSDSDPATAPSSSASPASSGTAVAGPEGVPGAAWAAILADLERRTGSAPEPEVVSAEEVTWNDGSLGCPEAGQTYTQALVDGYHIVVELDGERYDYRVGSGSSAKLCEGGPLEGGG